MIFFYSVSGISNPVEQKNRECYSRLSLLASIALAGTMMLGMGEFNDLLQNANEDLRLIQSLESQTATPRQIKEVKQRGLVKTFNDKRVVDFVHFLVKTQNSKDLRWFFETLPEQAEDFFNDRSTYGYINDLVQKEDHVFLELILEYEQKSFHSNHDLRKLLKSLGYRE